jgi:hypothetical protein
VFLITRGDTITHIGDVSPQNRQALEAGKVGYKYSYWGVFWVDLWTWGGDYCVYEGERYRPIQRGEAARLLGKPESELGTPFLYKVPLGWLILGPLILIGVISSVLEKRKRDPTAQLFEDPRYKRALDIFSAEYAKQPPVAEGAQAAEEQPPPEDGSRMRTALEAGVQHLIALGVPRDEAERNLSTMILLLAQAHQQEAGSPDASQPA